MRRRRDRRPGGRPSQVLVAGAGHLQLAGQVHPQLQGVRTFVTEGQLAMDDSAPGAHPLDVAGVQCAGVAKVVAVLEHAVEDEGDGLQTAVRVPLEPGRGEPVFAKHQESAFLTPLVVLLIDLLAPAGWRLAEDGLIDTLIGGTIVLLIGVRAVAHELVRTPAAAVRRGRTRRERIPAGGAADERSAGPGRWRGL